MPDLRRTEDAERLLLEKEQQLSAANKELEQRSEDVETLIRWLEQLDEQRSEDVETLTRWLESLVSSRRWKIGNWIIKLGRKVLLKPATPELMDEVNLFRKRFNLWRREFRIRREESRVRQQEFRTRREYLEQMKGRPGAIGTTEPQTLTPNIDELATASASGAASATVLPSAFPDRWRLEPSEHILNDLRDTRPVTIIVPIRDAYEGLRNCLESLVRNTIAPANLLLIDGTGAAPGISPLLAEYEALENVRVLPKDENSSFAETVNRCLSKSSGDVVMLGSATEVTPRWLENLRLAAYADPRTATVTAISNNAGAFSVPKSNNANSTLKGLDRDETGRLVMQQSAQIYPQTPTGHSFCMYIKRAALDEVGLLDAENFPQGQGVEYDFCMRAQKRGWNHVVDDTTFVFHKRLASSGGEKREVLKANVLQKLDELHPEYRKLAQAFVISEEMERVGGNIAGAYEAVESSRVQAKPRVLFVLHQAGGGTPYTSRDLMEGLADRYSPYVLVSDTLWLRLFRHDPEGLVLVEKWSLRRKWRITEFSRPDYRAIVFSLLVKYRFEIVHIRHLLGHTLDLPEISARLRIPVILSFHDFYISCPTMHLIDDHGKYCGGICTPGYGQCRLPKVLLGELPTLKHAWLKTWRRHVELMFEDVDAFVTTSFATKAVYLRSLASLRDRRFEVIEHGRDLEQEHLASPPGEGPIRILMPGNIEVHKGAEFLRKLKQVDAEERLEFHFLGNVIDEYRDLGVVHGAYKREEFNDRVGEIRPSFVGIFSIWPETYCHTLTEAWAAGVPVLVSDIGTLRERVNAHGGGWLLDYEDPQGSYERIIEIAEDRTTYARELEQANLHGIRSTREMSDDYDGLYQSVLHEHRSFKLAN